MSLGAIHSIYIAPAARSPMVSLETAKLEAGLGIEGDRYHKEIGSFSRWPGEGRNISLIEQETIEAVLAETGIDLTAGQSRRNLVTRGVDLDSLNGKVFRIGTAILRGARHCTPCRYLDRLVGIAVHDALRRRGGLRAQVLASGTITVGDSIELATFLPDVPVRKIRRRIGQRSLLGASQKLTELQAEVDRSSQH